jgi:Protein of unknown function (DUF1616)
VNRLPRHYDRDLAVVAALVLAGLAVTVVPLPDWLRAAVFLPVVLILPGYALTAALFPPGFITEAERAVLTIALSIGGWTLGGLALQVVIGLDRAAWMALLFVLSLVAVAVAQGRRGTAPADSGRPAWSLPPFEPRIVGAVLAAVAISTVAIAVASGSARRQLDRVHFSAIWIVPSESPTLSAGSDLTVGVQNHEGRALPYRLRVSQDGRTVREWQIRVRDGATWRVGLRRPAGKGKPLTAELFSGATIYRRVALEARRSP